MVEVTVIPSQTTLSDSNPEDTGTKTAGTGTAASRSDHVHALESVTNAKLGTDIAVGSTIFIPPMFYSSIGQGSWNAIFNVAARYCSVGWDTEDSPADGDNITYKVYLAAGTYKIWIIGKKGGTHGILDVDIDTVAVGTIDWYASSGQENQMESIASVSVTTNGLKDLRLRVDGKNGSSSNYIIYIMGIYIERTA